MSDKYYPDTPAPPGRIDPRTDFEHWLPTISAIRDLVLNDGTRHGLLQLEQEVKDEPGYEPVGEDGVQAFGVAMHDAVVAGRVVDLDLGSYPVSILDKNQKTVLQSYGGQNSSIHPFSDCWLLRLRIADAVVLYLINPQEPDKLNGGSYLAVQMLPVFFRGSDYYEGGNFILVGDRISVERDPNEAGMYNTYGWPGVFRFIVDEETGERVTHEKAMIVATQTAVTAVLFSLMLLSVAGSRRQTIVASDALQKARKKSGKQPIPPYEKVDVAPYVTELIARREKLNSERTGTHASPIPHLRRAHFMTRNGKRYPVRETRVNRHKEENGVTTPSRSHYKTHESLFPLLTEGGSDED